MTRRRADADRAQTSFDFLVGMSIFLLTVGFVLGLTQGILAPFSGETGENMIVADRTADRLAGDLLVENVTKPAVLDRTCTIKFFSGSGDAQRCRFPVDESNLSKALGVRKTVSMNVTIETDGEIVTLEGVALAAGRPVPSSRGRVESRRVVLIDGNRSTLHVRVW